MNPYQLNSRSVVSWDNSPILSRKRKAENVNLDSEIQNLGEVLADMRQQPSSNHSLQARAVAAKPGIESDPNSSGILKSWLSHDSQQIVSSDPHTSSEKGEHRIFQLLDSWESDLMKKSTETTQVKMQTTKRIMSVQEKKEMVEQKRLAAIKSREELLKKIRAGPRNNTLCSSNKTAVPPSTQSGRKRLKAIPVNSENFNFPLSTTPPAFNVKHNVDHPYTKPAINAEDSIPAINAEDSKPAINAKDAKQNVAQPNIKPAIVAEDDDSEFLDAMCSLAAKYDRLPEVKIVHEENPGIARGTLPCISSSALLGTAFVRFKVQFVEVGVETRLELLSRPGGFPCNVILRDSWAKTQLELGDYVNIVWYPTPAPNWREEEVVIDDSGHFIVVCPDNLVSATRIGGTLGCVRRAVLANNVQTFRASKPTVMGNMKHLVVESGFLPNGEYGKPPDFSPQHLTSFIDQAVRNQQNINQLYEVELSEQVAKTEMQTLIPALGTFSNTFLMSPSNDFSSDFLNPKHQGNSVDLGEINSSNLLIEKIAASEEKILSPMWGLIGQIDLMIKAKIQSCNNSVSSDILIPLELKTGRQLQVQHLAQVQLYSLLIGDRYRDLNIAGGYCAKSAAGVLMHVSKVRQNDKMEQAASLRGVKVDHESLRQLIIQRNKFSRACSPEWMKSPEARDASKVSLPLPAVVKNANGICENCYEKQSCMIFHKATEGGSLESSGLSPDTYNTLVGDLEGSYLEYFQKWNLMIDLESMESIGFQREIWTMAAMEREATGRCISNLELSCVEIQNSSSLSDPYFIKFSRKESSSNYYVDINELMFESGSYVAIGIESAHHAIAFGTIDELGSHHVIVRCSHPLPTPAGDLITFNWRVDLDERYAGKSIIKNNLLQIFYPVNSKSREAVVGLKPAAFFDDFDPRKPVIPHRWLRDCISLPQVLWSGKFKLGDIRNYQRINALTRRELMFSKEAKTQMFSKWNETHRITSAMYESLNEDQRRAVACVFAAKDFVCIRGMPGTGKTTTIAFLIQALQAIGASVLLCAYTHTAVDNVLLKLAENNVDFTRIGYEASTHPSLRSYLLESKVHCVADLKAMEENPRLVLASTCLGTKHALVQKRRFDFCIIDEAGQLTQPACFGPIFRSDTFVLVGDDNQLPPLVKSESAKKLGMDESLLQRLTVNDKECVAQLTMQFRMNKDIMHLANKMVYEDQLSCGNDTVANSILDMPNYDNAKQSSLLHTKGVSQHVQWLADVLDPSRSVLFLNTDDILAGAALERRAVYNTAATSMFLEEERLGLLSQIDAANNAVKKSGRHHGKLQNDIEAKLAHIIVQGLGESGCNFKEIGIISPYRSQLKTLLNLLSRYTPELEIQTVDKYQGRDKECIIVSLVRSNTTKDVGGLLKDWRRINVAFTRAKRKLIVIGSKQTLESSQVFSSFIKLVNESGWEYKLPAAAHLLYSHLDDQGESKPISDLEAVRQVLLTVKQHHPLEW